MEVVYPVCAGIDVHKKDVKACLIWRDAEGKRCLETRTFSTMTKSILLMWDWLAEKKCPIVAMESTGVYWKPIFNILEDEFEVMLVNPTHLKYVKGRKTDVKDAAWIAELLEHGLLTASFIPAMEIRDLRDLTRYRRKLINEQSAEVNRVQKVLEDANIKLAAVATDVMGVSARAILDALIGGEMSPEDMADLARGKLRNKIDELTEALYGRVRPHHVLLLEKMLKHIDFLNEAIADCDKAIEELVRPFQEKIERMDGVTGVDIRSSQDILAEIGVDMKAFPTHKHLCSWASICPGNNESGGKRQSGKTRKGNKWLRPILIQCAQAAGHSHDTYLGAQFGRFAARKGKQRAAMVVAHSILEAIYFILRDGAEYKDLGPLYFAKLNEEHKVRYHKKTLESLGYSVELRSPVAAA